jgi:ubiquinone biosynthesis accessory factor UbiJ
MSAAAPFLSFIERELNRLVGESTAARELLEQLDGTTFAVHLEGLGVTGVLHAESEHLRVGTDGAGATAALRATPLDLLRLARSEGVGGMQRTRASFSGDLEVAERYSRLLKLARPDLEDELAKWVGDIAAHTLGEAARGAGEWLARAASALSMNTAEYLQEESGTVPAPLEAQAFYADVERLRDGVERAAARLARLERH